MLGIVDLAGARDALGLSDRLAAASASATVRGVWFSMLADHMKRMDAASRQAFARTVPARRRSAFGHYSLREYLNELAVAGTLTSPRDPGAGIRQIWRGVAGAYTSTPFGRSLLRLLRPDPARFVCWLVDHRDHFCNYGSWKITRREDNYILMDIEDETIWIEHAHRGGAEGTLLACGVDGTVEAELSDRPYGGRLHIRWSPRS